MFQQQFTQTKRGTINSSDGGAIRKGQMTQELVYVRGTVTSSEQVLAGAIGLVTAGPLGAFASAFTLKGRAREMGPWTMAGVVGVPVCWLVQGMVLSGLGFVTGSAGSLLPLPTSGAGRSSSTH